MISKNHFVPIKCSNPLLVDYQIKQGSYWIENLGTIKEIKALLKNHDVKKILPVGDL